MKRQGIAIYVIGFLVVLGIIYQVSARPSSLLIPLLVFGIIFVLWKYPPHTWKSGTFWTKGGGKKYNSKAARKASFRVIQGNKDKREDEEPPKYH